MDDLFDLPTHLPNAETNTDVGSGVVGDENRTDGQLDQPQKALGAADSGPHQQDEHHDPNGPQNHDIDGEEGTKSKEPVVIPGTNITLQTEEDIQRWIAERKKNWPSKSNIERKQQQKHSEPEENSKKRQAPTGSDAKQPKRTKNICRFYMQYKSCKFGDNCKNVHEMDSDYTVINGIKTKLPKPYENNYYTRENASENSSLYKMLVKKEQFELENEKFVDFLLYMEKKGLIRHE